MLSLRNLTRYLQQFLSTPLKETAPADAYDMWSNTYDAQPDNLVLALDEIVFSGLLETITLTGKIVADIGCGTGRHWEKIFAKNPQKVMGFDVSGGMLNMLKKKFPDASTYILKNNLLDGVENNHCHLLISTLTLAHIGNMQEVIAEWNRVVKFDGDIIITDFHPESLKNGGNRTFRHNNKLVAVKNCIYELTALRTQAALQGWKEIAFIEKNITADLKHYYEAQQALGVYERFKNTPVLYGIHFKKSG